MEVTPELKPKDKRPPTFLSLPLEVRLLIWEAALCNVIAGPQIWSFTCEWLASSESLRTTSTANIAEPWIYITPAIKDDPRQITVQALAGTNRESRAFVEKALPNKLHVIPAKVAKPKKSESDKIKSALKLVMTGKSENAKKGCCEGSIYRLVAERDIIMLQASFIMLFAEENRTRVKSAYYQRLKSMLEQETTDKTVINSFWMQARNLAIVGCGETERITSLDALSEGNKGLSLFRNLRNVFFCPELDSSFEQLAVFGPVSAALRLKRWAHDLSGAALSAKFHSISLNSSGTADDEGDGPGTIEEMMKMTKILREFNKLFRSLLNEAGLKNRSQELGVGERSSEVPAPSFEILLLSKANYFPGFMVATGYPQLKAREEALDDRIATALRDQEDRNRRAAGVSGLEYTYQAQQ
jgi:hypothetical protein